MVTYRGDFILSDDDKFIIKQLDSSISSKGAIYNMERDIDVEGLGEISVKVIIDTFNGLKIQINSLKMDKPCVFKVRKRELYEIIGVYRVTIVVNGEEEELFLNIKLDKNDFYTTTSYLSEELRILRYKVEQNLVDDLLFYIQNLDLNYIINIIYAGFTINMYKLDNPMSSTSSIFELAFIDKLEKIGFIIPKENPDTLKKVELIANAINNFEKIKPEDLAFFLINTLSENFVSKLFIINMDTLYNATLSVIQYNDGLELL